MNKIPEIGKTYNCFDDGKITESRLYTVKVTNVIPFSEIDTNILNEWKEQTIQCDWLFNKETDYFVKTTSIEGNSIFVRTINNGWFSIGEFMNSGRLDIDGLLTKKLYDEN